MGAVGPVEAHLAINSPQAEFDAATACVREALVGDLDDRPVESPLRVHVSFEPHNYGPQGTTTGLSIDCDSLEPFTNGVPRSQPEIAPSDGHVLRIGGPARLADAERSEQIDAGELQGRHPGGLLEDGGKQMTPEAAVDELGPGLPARRPVQRELDPVGAGLHH